MSSTSDQVLAAGRAGQLIAGLGAVLVLLGPFAGWLAGAGVFVLILGVVLAAPAAGYPGPFMTNWWSVIAIAALACLVGFGLGFLVGRLGGVVSMCGGIVVLVSLSLAAPPVSAD